MASFYTASSWHEGKKGPPPIFASIGVRHPRCIELDIELREQNSLQQLFDFVGPELRQFDAGNVIIAVAQIPKVPTDRNLAPFQDHRVWMELQDRMRKSVCRLEPRGLSMLAYALARMEGWRDDELIASVLQSSLKHMLNFGPTDAAKLAWSLAKLNMGESAQEVWAALSKEAAKKICASGRFIDISMTAWAFAKAGKGERVLFGQLATAAMECTDLPPHTIANLVWAFAKTRNPNPPLLEFLAKIAVENVSVFDRQSISNTVWAYATLDYCHEELFATFAKHTVESGAWRDFSPQMCSNLVWAYAKVGVTIIPLFDAFAEYIAIHADKFDTQNISNCAWAYAMAQLPTKTVFETLTACACGRLDRFRLDELCGLLWAFVRAKVPRSPVFEEAVQLLLPRVSTLDQQSVSNLLWALATCQHMRGGEPVGGSQALVDAMVSAMLDLRVRVDSEGAAMVIWALWRIDRFHDAWTLYVRTLSDGRHPEHGKTGFTKRHAVDGRQRYYQTLLMEIERRKDVQKQVYLWKQMAADFYSRALRTACLNCALSALIGSGDIEGAKAMAAQQVRTRLFNGVTQQLLLRVGLAEEDIEPAEIVDITIRRRPQSQSRFEDFHYKETSVLEAVLASAMPGNAASVHAAVENVGLKEVWLKVAGGEKACVLDNVLITHKPKRILEYGTYVGYTCTRMALRVAEWGGKVVTMEMDPVNATIARNHIALAGLSGTVTVQLGHSDDAVQVLFEEYGPGSFDMVFMDQRGTAFHEDLQHLEAIGILADPCVLVADNVLKPGAPYHVWRICSMPHYRTDIIDLREFGSAPVEDWMTVSWVHRGETYGKPAQELRELTDLARESDRFRLRAMATSMKDLVGDPLDEFAAKFTSVFARMGINVSMYVQTDVTDTEDGEQVACSRLVRLQPGEIPPKWDGDDPRDAIQGGRWISHIGGVAFAGAGGDAVYNPSAGYGRAVPGG
eukprot:CAMPEP_0178409162 /NCGR_PEP_ID=MMETSP0689_2-20121128/20320_1 /TAXON_ID=160604 /ORGANISM="Amphidinium massartii, Strain CS-259" /LENGTH=962 /DNA_ID=CAMNT_0020030295 /DNA_START=43 /DNA_END=2931 /DNA_ORIENTATION=+